MAKQTETTARLAQRKHWETTGQIVRMIRLIDYIVNYNQALPKNTLVSLNTARRHLLRASWHEQSNNQFINLKLPRGF
jgi:hypothetical protein